jgi:hypothetical protein
MHFVFLVHGMGDFASGWSNTIQTALKKYYDPAKYAFLKDFPFDANFKFVEITYNQIFTEYLAEAKTQAATLAKWNKLTAGLTGDALGILQKVVGAASGAPANNFLVNYLGDVAFYMATDIGQEIKNDIIGQIGKGLGASYDPSQNDWSIIAHSLGTRVVTEVLQAGFTATPSLRAFGKAKLLMQVANVSKLLEDLPYHTGDVYHNAVYPSSTGTNGVCSQFINASHGLDPFTFIDAFDPGSDFGDRNALINGLYHPVNLSAADITSKNVHSLDHYMLHPSIHTTLFQYLVPGGGWAGPTSVEMNTAMAEYHTLTLQAQVSADWKAQLANLKSDPFSTIPQIFALWQKYGALLGEVTQQVVAKV